KLLSFLPDATTELLDDIIAKMVEWGMFDAGMFDNHGVLTSRDIQRQYFRTRKRESHSCALPYLLDGERPAKRAAAPAKTRATASDTNFRTASGRHIDALPLSCSPEEPAPLFAELTANEKQERADEAAPALMVDGGV
ncbi:MAG: DUF4373 domain-containing protein, partial [Muribaculaceae bacterium]|nr:DUF4373 domain-containing protein [Muribaculaceae bacterium]